MERGLISSPNPYNKKKATSGVVEEARISQQDHVEGSEGACSEADPSPSDVIQGLRAVFDMCDVEKQGFITVKAFEELAKVYLSGSTEALSDILQLLQEKDSNAVRFEEFCYVVQTVCKQNGVDVNSDDSSYNTYEDTSLEDDRSSISTQNAFDWTFNEYDIMTDQDDAMTIAAATPSPSATSDDVMSRSDTPVLINVPDCNSYNYNTANNRSVPPLAVPLITTNGVKVQRNEEYFEDFGDILSTDCEPDSVESDELDGISACSSCADSISNKRILRRKRDSWLSASSTSYRSRKPSAHSLAVQLQLRSLSANNSPRRSLDDLYGDCTASDTDVLDLNDKVRRLERKLNDLLEDQVGNSSQKSKLKSENEMLMKRVYMLEEQLHDTRIKSEGTIDETKRKYDELLSRKEKEHRTESDRLQTKLQDYQHENLEFREEAPRIRNQMEVLRHSNDKLKEALNDRGSSLNSLETAYDKQQEQLKMERERRDIEKKQFQQAISDMTKDLNELQQFKVGVDLETKCRSPSFAEMPSRYRELQLEVTKLKKECISLRESNEELTAQMLSQSIQKGQDLLEEQKSSPARSLAHELETATKEQLMSALKEQEEQNRNLRAYVDKVLLAVLENNPSILEVTRPC